MSKSSWACFLLHNKTDTSSPLFAFAPFPFSPCLGFRLNKRGCRFWLIQFSNSVLFFTC
ncbi:hypothetical protein THIOM_003762 [Candidatus Thiomargarita nelsonii]|uniref:Uncharacterized protein n=1 Tax=Candidatus Thiomargarita nelsonii TaxID=1003181 RepID=A0A176RXV0_9GAMM|nr:hypothetical protein THIOM_003762 [Candidatus Thiomargarita nelsonii]